jgi:hypothetical protein
MDTPRANPAFVAVDWAAEHLDGLVIVALLQSEGIDAFLHNENFVRQDWFYILAYGGFRILVPAQDAAASIALLAAFRAGELALDEAIADHPRCPECAGTRSENDPRPRRQVFNAFLFCVYGAFPLMIGESITGSATIGALGAMLLIVPYLATLAPGVLRWHVLRRYRCLDCNTRWRAPALPGFGQLQHDAQT